MFKKILLIILCLLTIPAYPQVLDRDDNLVQGNILTTKPIESNKEKQIIKIAIILPLSGTNEGTGKRLKKSIPIIQDLNENFKYDAYFGLKYKFDVSVYDDGCDAKKAETIAQNIVDKKDILFVIGHFCSAASLAAAPIYEKAGIIQITPFSTEASLTQKGYDTLFRLAGRNDRYGEVAADWLNEFRNRYKLATIYSDDVYGKSLVKSVIIGLDLRKKTSNQFQDNYYKTPYNLKDYQNNIPKLVDTLIKDNVKLIYFGGYYTELIKIIKEVKRRNAKILFFAGDSIQNYDFWLQSGGQGENVIFTLTKDVTRDISQRELNEIKRTSDFNKLKRDQGLEEAIRVYGIQSSRSIFVRNRVYKDRARFIKTYFEKFHEFPDLYMSHLYAVFEIIKDIITAEELKDIFMNLEEKNLFNSYQLGQDISSYMKDKGYNSADENIGFRTILGTINFSISGEWVNAEYVIYRWVDKKQERNWLTDKENYKFIGSEGDFVRLF